MIAIFAIALFVGPPLWVAFTASPSDLARIKARYERLENLGGPNTQVLSIQRRGTRFSGQPGIPSSRIYDVQLLMSDGREFSKVVTVDASILGQGEMTETVES
ncbi:hypothetical protein [Caulobacter sp. SSI4214]|uniref:hypothetical protein n=1 Tax=Caulobacter sp. SSI4214 TaxID=2575739 RepID=UPI0014391B73|nr:hypothetical protein [Caulobacter sp. SSI4214]